MSGLVNFRRITYMLLGTSGLGLLIKAAGAITLFAVTATAAAQAAPSPVARSVAPSWGVRSTKI